MPVIAWDSVCSLSPAESFRQYARRTHDAGRSYNQIARELNTSHAAVRMALRADQWKGTPEEAPPLPAPEPTGPDVETTVVLSDVHVPCHDPDAVRVALSFIEWLKPDTVVLNGDILDMYQLSRFDRDPKRSLEIQDDLNQLYDFFRQVRKAAPKAALHMCEGNHERRLKTYLSKHPEIAGLSVLDPVNLFKLDSFGIEWHPVEETWMHHGIVITHGTIVRKHAGRSAQGEWEKYVSSGISGHVHRLGACLKTTLNATYGWYECGCLSNLTPEYMIGVPDWQQGLCVGRFLRGDNRFAIEQVPIIKGRILYQGQVFG